MDAFRIDASDAKAGGKPGKELVPVGDVSFRELVEDELSEHDGEACEDDEEMEEGEDEEAAEVEEPPPAPKVVPKRKNTPTQAPAEKTTAASKKSTKQAEKSTEKKNQHKEQTDKKTEDAKEQTQKEQTHKKTEDIKAKERNEPESEEGATDEEDDNTTIVWEAPQEAGARDCNCCVGACKHGPLSCFLLNPALRA